MPVVTSQKISSLYELYRTIDVTFTKEIIQVTNLMTNQVYLTCIGDFWPCVIYSSSFQGAKIVANTKTGIIKKIDQANNSVSLRYSFKNQDTGNPVAFFVNAKCTATSPYGGSKDMAMINLQFTQRPPDDLIEIMGRILEANFNSAKRKEERILITPDSIRRLNLETKECVVLIQGVPRRCILRDISFTGAKIIMVGVEKFLMNKDAALRIDFHDPKETQTLKGKFIRAEPVEGRKELVALALVMDEPAIPMGYKIRINEFISQIRADTRGNEEATIATDRKEITRDTVPDADFPAAAGPAAVTEAALNTKNAPQETLPHDDNTGIGDFDLELPEK